MRRTTFRRVACAAGLYLLSVCGANSGFALEPTLQSALPMQPPVPRPLDPSAPPMSTEASSVPLPFGDTSPVLLSTHELSVPRGTRLLIFAPHPDDETIAAAGLIQQVLSGGGAVRIVFVTNGDGYAAAVREGVHRSDASASDFVAYGQRRHDEALAALARLGLNADAAVFLGFPDDGIDDLWSGHWSEREPYTSPYTRFNRPPYRDSIRPDIEYAGVDLESEIRTALEQWRPTWIVTPDPRDSHPDHCTTGVFVLDTLRLLRKRTPRANWPAVYGYLVHAPQYPSSNQWLQSIAHAGVGGSHTASESLQSAPWMRLGMNSSQEEKKIDALWAYDTQLRSMRPFLVQFLRNYELFSRLDETQIQAVPRDYAARFRRAH